MSGWTAEKQAARAKRLRDAGLCPGCSKVKDGPYKWFCIACSVAGRLRNRKTAGTQPWRPGGRGRPPLVR